VRQPAVVGQPLDRFMNKEVGVVIGVDAAGGGVVGQRLVQRLERGQVGVGRLQGGLVGAAPLEHGHQRENVFQVAQRQLVDEAAATRFKTHQAFGGQYLEGLAQWRARNAQQAR